VDLTPFALLAISSCKEDIGAGRNNGTARHIAQSGETDFTRGAEKSSDCTDKIKSGSL
jgi:hypothetical protein